MSTSQPSEHPPCPQCGGEPKPLEAGSSVYQCSQCDHDYQAPAAPPPAAGKAKDELGRVICDKCNGRGMVTHVDILHAKSTWVPCKKCNGTGYLGPEEGLYVVPIKGSPLYYQWYKKGAVVSQMMLVAVPCIMRDAEKVISRHITVEIHAMWTDPKHRREGIMGKMLDLLKVAFQGEVRYIYTNWNDSTEMGKKFLTARGFERKSGVLIWEREPKPGEGGQHGGEDEGPAGEGAGSGEPEGEQV